MNGWERWLLDFLAANTVTVIALAVVIVGVGAGRELVLWWREQMMTRRAARLDRAIAARMRQKALR